MAIELPGDVRTEVVASIKLYFREERGVEIGDLQAGFFLDFVLEEIGPSIYNRAVHDVQRHLQTVVSDLDVTIHEPEFGYTAARGGHQRRR